MAVLGLMVRDMKEAGFPKPLCCPVEPVLQKRWRWLSTDRILLGTHWPHTQKKKIDPLGFVEVCACMTVFVCVCVRVCVQATESI